jgi:hypothetical protein
MKIRSLFLFSLLIFCACRFPQEAQTNEFSNQTNSNQEISAVPVENRQPEVEKKKPVDDARLATVEIRKVERKGKYSLKIDVEYPQLKEAKSAQEKEFNRHIKKQIDEKILGFTDFLADREKTAKTESRTEFSIGLDYKAEYVSDKIVSVFMNWHSFSGYLNEDYSPATVNFDLVKGKTIRLPDLFEPKANYLEKLSGLALEKLKRTCLSCSCEGGINAGEPLPEGVVNKVRPLPPGGMFDLGEATLPKAESFDKWSVNGEGLKITFDEYEVGPGCIGIIHIVIPFNDLQPILRKDLNFN